MAWKFLLENRNEVLPKDVAYTQSENNNSKGNEMATVYHIAAVKIMM